MKINLTKAQSSLKDSIGFFCKHSDLINQLSRRDVLERYKGSMFGLLWSFLYPLLMLLVYYIVFGVVFNMRWGDERVHVAFGTIMFSGLILHSMFSECLVRSTGLIVNNANFVKKVVFPLEAYAVVTVSTAVFHFIVGMFILVCFNLVSGGGLQWTLLLTPLVLAPLVLMLLGLSWFLSAFSVFVRDTAQVMNILSTILLFISPVFYPLSAVPAGFRFFMYFNPITIPVIEFRKVAILGEWPDFWFLLVYLIAALIVYIGGWMFFSWSRRSFADVL